jgi:hypothetical protein
MKHQARLSVVALVALCGAASLLLVARGRGDGGVEIIGPNAASPSGTGKESPRVAPSPPVRAAAVNPIPSAPVGTVVAWLKNQTNTPALPPEWVECNGQILSLAGSPYHGATIPNLNGVGEQPRRFLRGSSRSGATGGSEEHRHGSFLTTRSGQRTVNVSAWDSASHLPPFYDVVWIMRVL